MKTAKQIIEPLIFPDRVVLETVGEDIHFVSANDAINAMEKYAKEYHESRTKEECCHPFEKVISAGALHNCTVCGQNIEVATRKNK